MRGAPSFPILVFVLTSVACNSNSQNSTPGTGGTSGTGMCPMNPTTVNAVGCECVPGAYVRNGACQCGPGMPDVCPTVGCTDKATDPFNCGMCGMTCGTTSTCNGGTCGPAPTVLLPPVAGCLGPLTIAVNAGTVYYADASNNTINKVGASAPLAMNEMGATWLALNGSDLYWYNKGTNTIRKLAGATDIPTDVFTPSTMTVIVGDVDTVGGFLVTPDGLSVYVSVGLNVVKISATTAGGGTPIVVAQNKSTPGALALNGTASIVYPTDAGRVYAATLSATPASCGVFDALGNAIMDTCVTLARQAFLFLDFIAVIGNKAYWIDGPNINAEMLPAAGGMGGTWETLSTGNRSLTAATNTTDTIYFAEDGIIEKAPAASNPNRDPPILLARGQLAPTSIAVGATKVYWSTADCAIASQNR
jgi:hypothetical protein